MRTLHSRTQFIQTYCGFCMFNTDTQISDVRWLVTTQLSTSTSRFGRVVALAVTNFGLLCFLVMLMIDHYASNYNLMSWSTVFHVLCFLWLSLRGIFWFLTITAIAKWGNSTFYILYWVPCPLEFGSFLLLPLFFAQILYPKEWKTYWSYVCSIYMAVVFGLTGFMVCWAILREKFDVGCNDNDSSSCFYSEYTSMPLRGVTAICFLFLAATQAAYGLK
eukprot:gene5440-10912_t